MLERNIKFKEQIYVETMLYGDPPVFEYIEIKDKDFLVKLFGMYPKFRPHHLESFVIFCSHYLKEDSFRRIVLQKTFPVCPTLIHRLYKKNYFSKDEIRDSLLIHERKLLCLFFKKDFRINYSRFRDEIFPQDDSDDQDYSDDGNEKYSSEYRDQKELDFLINYGFYPSSIEFCLKYDQLDELKILMVKKPEQKKCLWNPFEWSNRPKSLDCLSFCGFYGSIKCFRVLLLSGFVINEQVVRNVVCSGSNELFLLIMDSNLENLFGFHEASWFHQMSFLEFFIDNGTEINSRNDKLETPLHLSSLNGHLQIVEYLVNHGADVNLENNRYETPLHFSSLNGHFQIVEYLVNHGTRVNCKNDNQETPLHLSSLNGHFQIVEYLVNHGADVNFENNRYETPLHLSSLNGHFQIVEYLVNHGAIVNSKNIEQETPLHLSSLNGHLQIVEYLVNHGADVNLENNRYETPLHLSSLNGHFQIVEYLVNHGAIVNSKNIKQETPHYLSSMNNHFHVAKYLKDIYYMIEQVFQASLTGNLEIITQLMQNNPNFDVRDESSSSLMYYSNKNGHFGIVKFLLNHGADINCKNYIQETPLHLSSLNGHFQIVEYHLFIYHH